MRLAIAFSLTVVALVTGVSAPARAQDDALDKLLKKLDDSPKPPAPEAKPGDGEKPAPKPDQVAPEDESLDNLLKKLGETGDKPTPEDERPKAPGLMPPDQPKPGDAQSKPKDPLNPGDKDLDEHLDSMLRKRKPKDQQQQGGGQGGGGSDSPLGQAIKKMEEATKRLTDNDTGEQTRKTQGDVVKQLDQILEQLRQSQSSQKSQRSKQIQQAGTKPGQSQQQNNDQPNGNAQGVGLQQPKKPKLADVLAGTEKDTWGDLPAHLRDEMENVFREEMLPAKRDLIIKYYSNIARKGREGGNR